MTTDSTSSTKLEELSAEFPKSEVKSRAGSFGKNLDYIDISSTIRRFNGVLGSSWSVIPTSVDITPLDDAGQRYFASVVLQLEALGKTALGIGCDIDKDPDKAVKTALAEGIKKAGHQFGVALYLWDEAKRDEIADFRKLANASISTLQAAVMTSKGLTKEKLVAAYGDLLKSREGLLSILDGSSTGA